MLWSQSSYTSTSAEGGKLYLVPTPIGNLEDITYRALEILKQVDYIAAEDTRHSRKLLSHFDIPKPLVSYHEHNKLQSGDKILKDLQVGKQIAIVTDAGMPGISDPGADLVQAALQHQIPVIALPGANAALTALIASGEPTEQFLFVGFLDRLKKKKKEQLESVSRLPYTLIFYEAPHRIKETLELMQDVLGNRHLALARELSKKHEEYVRGTMTEILDYVQQNALKGEMCLVVSGADQRSISTQEEEAAWWEKLDLQQHIEHYMKQKLSSKEAIKRVAKERSMPKRDVYQSYHVHDKQQQ